MIITLKIKRSPKQLQSTFGQDLIRGSNTDIAVEFIKDRFRVVLLKTNVHPHNCIDILTIGHC